MVTVDFQGPRSTMKWLNLMKPKWLNCQPPAQQQLPIY